MDLRSPFLSISFSFLVIELSTKMPFLRIWENYLRMWDGLWDRTKKLSTENCALDMIELYVKS